MPPFCCLELEKFAVDEILLKATQGHWRRQSTDQFIIVVWSKLFMLQQGWTWVMGQLFTTQPDLPDAESMVNPIHV